MRTGPILVLIGLPLLHPFAAEADTRSLALDCIRKFHNIDAPAAAFDDQPVAFAPSEATQLLRDIARGFEQVEDTEAINCDQVSNATVITPISGELPGKYLSTKFVLYDRQWLRTALGRDRDMAIFVFGHELGHLWRGHEKDASNHAQLNVEKESEADKTALAGSAADKARMDARRKIESEADYDGACAVARLGGRWDAIVDIVSRIRGDVDDFYPSVQTSVRLAKEAFSKCGGSDNFSPSPDTETLYFFKRADEGRVVDAMNELGIKLVVRQSGIYRGYDFSNNETDTVTCHPGAPIELVRSIALKLHDAGVELRAISNPDPVNQQFHRRVTIQSTTKTRPLLTRAQISALSYCPADDDPVYGKRRSAPRL